jgi:hypothetical protein
MHEKFRALKRSLYRIKSLDLSFFEVDETLPRLRPSGIPPLALTGVLQIIAHTRDKMITFAHGAPHDIVICGLKKT